MGGDGDESNGHVVVFLCTGQHKPDSARDGNVSTLETQVHPLQS